MKTLIDLLRSLRPTLAVRILLFFLVKKLLAIPAALSFSQTGEDSILAHYLPERTGFYVDVGANDPILLSSSFRFYLKGWHGIAIDANDQLVKKFKRDRKRDICVAAAVSDGETDVIFHRSEVSAVSTIDSKKFETWRSQWNFRPEDEITVRTKTLTSILGEILPNSTVPIDFMSIDVEGHEFQVLSGLDLNRYRPRLIVVEMHDTKSILSDPSYLLLTSRDYSLVGYVTFNAYFVDNSNKERIG